MKLSTQKYAEAEQLLEGQWRGSRLCPICQNSDWSIPDRVLELREFQGGSMVVGGDSVVIPLILVTCTTCGYSVLLNAMTLGLMDPPTSKEAEH